MFAYLMRGVHRKRRGFTLIELVVVLAILAVIIALAIPRYLAARKKAYKSEADNILQETKSPVNSFESVTQPGFVLSFEMLP